MQLLENGETKRLVSLVGQGMSRDKEISYLTLTLEVRVEQGVEVQKKFVSSLHAD